MALVEFPILASAYVINAMLVISETRRIRLVMLEKKHGTLAALNVALGWPRTDSRLSQIKNQSAHSKTKKPRTMGDDIARHIEQTLGLEEGWMDTPPKYEVQDSQIAHAVKVMEAMPTWQREQAVKIIDTLAQPSNGTHG